MLPESEPARRAPASSSAITNGQRIWLEALYLGVPGSVELKPIDPETGKPRRRRWIPRHSDGKAQKITAADLDKLEDAIAKAEGDGLNAYVGIATRSQGGGYKHDLGFVRAAWCDVDRSGVTVETIDKKCDLMDVPRPSLIVHSGKGLHCYWLLAEPLLVVAKDERGRENLDRLEAINRGIAFYLKGDKASIDAGRILRPPETTNRPDAKKRAKGRVEAPVRLLRADGDRRYSLEDLDYFEKQGRLRVVQGGGAGGSPAEPLYERRDDDGELPKRVRKVIERDDRVRARFEGDDSKLRDATDSGIDASLASLLILRGRLGWEVEAALRRSREERGAAKSPEEKGDGYFIRTVNRALALAADAKRRSAKEAFNVEA